MKILVIGTNRGGHFRLIARGHELTLLGILPFGVAADFRCGYKNLVYLAEGATEEQFRTMARALHACTPFDLVHSFIDHYQCLAADIAADLGIACRHKKEATRISLDKARTRDVTRAAGFSRLDYWRVQDASQLRDVLARARFPVIAKPLEGTASKNVFRIGAADEVPDTLASCLPMIVESFIDGAEYSVESFSEGGRHRILGITEKFKTPVNFVEIGHIVPARIDAALWRRIEDFTGKVLDAVGIEDGPGHTEIMVAGEAIELIETHTRTGGDEIPNLVRLACGQDLYDLEARQIAGERVLDSIPQPLTYARHAAIWYLTPDEPEPRTLAAIDGADEAAAMPAVSSVKVEKQPGAAVHKLGHSFDRGAHAIAVEATGDAALAAAQAAAQLRYRFQ
jgi:biotin carboxylase